MNVSIVPWINEGMAVIIWVTTPFPLLETIRFGERSFFAQSFGKRIIGNDFFPLMAEEPLSFAGNIIDYLNGEDGW